MPKETDEQFRMILDFPFEELESHLVQNYDPEHTKAKRSFDFLKEHDLVLFDAMLKWGREHEEKWGLHSNRTVVIAGVMLCYDFLKEKAEKKGVSLPSFANLGKQPDPHVDEPEERQQIAQIMQTEDPDLVSLLGKMVWVFRSFEFKVNPGANDPSNPVGAFLVLSALRCYDAFRRIAA